MSVTALPRGLDGDKGDSRPIGRTVGLSDHALLGRTVAAPARVRLVSPSLEFRNRRREPNSHEEAGKRLREVLQVRGRESPAEAKIGSTMDKASERQTVHVTEINNQSRLDVQRMCRGREQMEPGFTPLADVVPP